MNADGHKYSFMLDIECPYAHRSQNLNFTIYALTKPIPGCLILEINQQETPLVRVPTSQGKQGKCQQKKSLSGKTQGILKFCQNTGNLVCSSCKFPDSNRKRYYFDICRENFNIFSEAGKVCNSQ